MADEQPKRARQPRTNSTPPRRVDAVLVQADDNALATQMRGEVEMMMEMARRYPRSIEEFTVALETMTCKDEETADECSYALPRDGKTIDGPSIRFAECALYCWGNMVAFAMPVSDDGKSITCRGVAWDMERNIRQGGDSKRRITTKEGDRYSDDMVIVTMNAGNSVAKRNAILQAIPSNFWRPIYEKTKVIALGKTETIATKRANLCDALVKIGAKLDLVWKTFGVKGPADLNLTQIATIRGYYKAIRDGQITVEDAFPDDQAPSLSGELADATMKRLAEEQMELSADIEAEFKRRGFNQAQRLQKLTEYNGRWDALLVWLRGDLPPTDAAATAGSPAADVPATDAPAVSHGKPEDTAPADAGTKQAIAETKAAPAETTPAATAAPRTVAELVQQTIAEVAAKLEAANAARKVDPFADVRPSNEDPPKQNRMEQARQRMGLKPGQTF